MLLMSYDALCFAFAPYKIRIEDYPFAFWHYRVKTRPDGRYGQALIYGSWFGSPFMNLGSVHGFVHGFVYGT